MIVATAQTIANNGFMITVATPSDGFQYSTLNFVQINQ